MYSQLFVPSLKTRRANSAWVSVFRAESLATLSAAYDGLVAPSLQVAVGTFATLVDFDGVL